MKTRTHTARILFAAVALSALASFAHAGPPPEFWNRTSPVATVKEAEAVKPDDTVDTLWERIKVREREFYPQVLLDILSGQIVLSEIYIPRSSHESSCSR